MRCGKVRGKGYQGNLRWFAAGGGLFANAEFDEANVDLSGRVSSMEEEINNKVNALVASYLKKSALDMFYPVGTVYTSLDSTFNPNTMWGGTWVEEDEYMYEHNIRLQLGGTSWDLLVQIQNKTPDEYTDVAEIKQFLTDNGFNGSNYYIASGGYNGNSGRVNGITVASDPTKFNVWFTDNTKAYWNDTTTWTSSTYFKDVVRPIKINSNKRWKRVN